MEIRMSRDAGQPRWAWTEGLGALGQQEVATPLPWPEGDARDEQVMGLLRFLEGYVAGQPRGIVAGQTLRYGWALLRFVADEEGHRLMLEEMRDPWRFGEAEYVPGVARTLALKWIQDEALRRNRMTGSAVYPHRASTAIVCSRVTPETIGRLRPLGVHRLEEPGEDFSGWFVGCEEGGHDHDDADELEQVHLLHLVAGFPGLFAYLALPVQTALLFEAERVIVFRPGEQEGFADPAPILAALP